MQHTCRSSGLPAVASSMGGSPSPRLRRTHSSLRSAALKRRLERVTRLELATSSLARRCSTTELHPRLEGRNNGAVVELRNRKFRGVAESATNARFCSITSTFHHSISPTPEEFREFAKRGNLIPLIVDLVADVETPVSAFAKVDHG